MQITYKKWNLRDLKIPLVETSKPEDKSVTEDKIADKPVVEPKRRPAPKITNTDVVKQKYTETVKPKPQPKPQPKPVQPKPKVILQDLQQDDNIPDIPEFKEEPEHLPEPTPLPQPEPAPLPLPQPEPLPQPTRIKKSRDLFPDIPNEILVPQSSFTPARPNYFQTKRKDRDIYQPRYK